MASRKKERKREKNNDKIMIDEHEARRNFAISVLFLFSLSLCIRITALIVVSDVARRGDEEKR